MPSNPSEIQRLQEEYHHLRSLLKGKNYRDKQTKEKILRELHEVEQQLGIAPIAYNSSDF